MIAGLWSERCRRGGIPSFLAALGISVVLASAAQASAPSVEQPIRVAPGVYLADAASFEGEGDRAGERRRSGAAAPRVVGGKPTSIAQVPWQAAVTLNPAVYSGNAVDRQFCGGSLVAPILVITAAHCLVNPNDGTLISADELAVVTGRTRLSSDEGEELPVADRFLFVDGQGNPLYDGRTSAWDIALLQLAQPSTSTPIKVVGLDERELWAEGRAASVSGWGATSFQGPGSDELLAAELSVLPDPHCVRSLPGVFRPETSFCVGVTGGERDSCQGDSGGPLVAPTLDGGARLIGDVQAGFECGRLGNPGFYGRFGADPLNGALRNGAMQIAGVDIVGSGALPPTTLTPNQATELAWVHSENKCVERPRCAQYDIGRCRPLGAGFRCPISYFARTKRGRKYNCSRKLLWTADTGTIQRQKLGRWECFRGW